MKWCGEVESRLAAANHHALSQTESIDALFRAIDEISSEARAKRLELDKLVKARKVAIREDIVTTAAKSLQIHIDQINSTLGGKARMPKIVADFAGAIKGKKTIASLRDAADSELARAKIEASQTGDKMRTNLNSFAELAADYVFLFNDLQQLVLKENEDLVPLIKVRISEHQRAEEIRLEAQREQIRQQEVQRLEREANERAAAAEAVGKAPVATPAANPVEPPARRVTNAAPSAKVPPKQTKLEAKVTDLEALVKAVYEGRARCRCRP
ncbi:hypothetical protein IFT99_09490 [Pseudomonas sp. CFBP 8772]|nr:hypothetical protein [Pseudomonas sp. CFBP 8772]